MKFARLLGFLMAGAVLIAACGSTSEPAPEAVSGPAPFDAVLIELFGTDDTEAYLASAERMAAEFVVTCMSDAGFEFQIPPVTSPLAPPDPTSIEDARTRGFGILDAYRQQIR